MPELEEISLFDTFSVWNSDIHLADWLQTLEESVQIDTLITSQAARVSRNFLPAQSPHISMDSTNRANLTENHDRLLVACQDFSLAERLGSQLVC